MSHRIDPAAPALALALLLTAAPAAYASQPETTAESPPARTAVDEARVRDAVQQVLDDAAALDGYDIEVQVEGASVALNGAVKTDIERDAAGDLAAKAAPGFEIDNQIVVGRGEVDTEQIPGVGAASEAPHGGGVTTTIP